MMRSFAAVLILLPLFFSCKEKSLPQGILKPEKMQVVLWDMIRADVFTENFIARDSSKNKNTENIKLQKQVLQENAVTKEEFYNSLDYYKKNPAVFGVMLDSLSARAMRNRENYVKPMPTVKPVIDKAVN